MKAPRIFCLSLVLTGAPLLLNQAPAVAQQSVSSDDISVADGLQLPTYGHIWALDSWKGLHELVRLQPPDAMSEDGGFSLKLRHTIEFKGEAAAVRVHDASPTFFLRGVSGNESGRADLAVVHLGIDGQRRTVSKETLAQLKQQARHAEAQYPEVIGVKQQRVGATDWYRLSPNQILAPGEYALVPLASSQGFAEGEVFDFAIDPTAPENTSPLRSEQYRNAP